MSRDVLYGELRSRFEREAGPDARAALRWVGDGMGEPLGSRALATFVRLAATAPLDLTDDHFDALRKEGFDDAALFELVTAAALGAGIARRERALAVLRKEAPR